MASGYQDRFVWDRKFTCRQEKFYHSDDQKLDEHTPESLLAAFFAWGRLVLDPPQYSWPSLRSFLGKAAKENNLVGSDPISPDVLMLLDDRRDPTSQSGPSDQPYPSAGHSGRGEHHAGRNWDGYEQYPPRGVDTFRKTLGSKELYAKLRSSVCGVLTFTVSPRLTIARGLPKRQNVE